MLAVRCKGIEGPILFFPVQEIRVGIPSCLELGGPLINRDKSARLRIRQWIEHDTIHDREKRCVYADAERER